MKSNIITLFALTLLLAFTACKEQSNLVESPEKDQLLARTWVLDAIEVIENNTPAESTAEYQNLSIQFKLDGTYTAQGGHHAFPNESGTWAWANTSLKKDIVLDAETETEAYLNVQTLEADLIECYFMREGEIVSAGREQVIPDREFTLSLKGL